MEESKLKSLVIELYEQGPGTIETISSKGVRASSGICLIDMGLYYDMISDALVEYICLYKKLVKINENN